MPGTYLDMSQETISYSDFVNKVLHAGLHASTNMALLASCCSRLSNEYKAIASELGRPAIVQ